jgi:hypothetical protein
MAALAPATYKALAGRRSLRCVAQCLRREPVFLTQSSFGWVELDRIHAEAFLSALSHHEPDTKSFTMARAELFTADPELVEAPPHSAMNNSGNRY